MPRNSCKDGREGTRALNNVLAVCLSRSEIEMDVDEGEKRPQDASLLALIFLVHVVVVAWILPYYRTGKETWTS